MSFPARHRKPYRQDEIALVFLVARSDESKAALAQRLQRTPSAIDWIWRWMDGQVENFPARAWNRLVRQIVEVRTALGDARRGELLAVPVASDGAAA